VKKLPIFFPISTWGDYSLWHYDWILKLTPSAPKYTSMFECDAPWHKVTHDLSNCQMHEKVTKFFPISTWGDYSLWHYDWILKLTPSAPKYTSTFECNAPRHKVTHNLSNCQIREKVTKFFPVSTWGDYSLKGCWDRFSWLENMLEKLGMFLPTEYAFIWMHHKDTQHDST